MVQNLWVGCGLVGKFSAVFGALAFYGFKESTFYTKVLGGFIHDFLLGFLSVFRLFLHKFHIPYNKQQVIKLNIVNSYRSIT